MNASLFSTVRTICRCVLQTWSRHISYVAASLIPPLIFLVIEAFAAAAVAHSPVALVTLDRGARGQQMAQILHRADVFRITDATPAQAQFLLKQLDVAAVIVIPADFTQRFEAHESSPVEVTINNLNIDFTNDIRRAVPDAITQFYAAQGSSSPIAVHIREQDLRDSDVQLFEYEVIPTLVLIVLVCGLINTAVGTAREYEVQTMKELLLSPASNLEIVLGKVLAGFLIAFFSGVLVLGIGAALGWTSPSGWNYWLNALLIIALVALFAASVGNLVGSWLRRIQASHALSAISSVYLFFLAGGVAVLAFEPVWLQQIGTVIPLAYANHALQMAVFYHSSDLLGRDAAVLALSTAAPLFLTVLLVRRSARA